MGGWKKKIPRLAHERSLCVFQSQRSQLFGLPEGHYSYLKNINQGLVLFLFNYSDRKLHGIFQAASHGQLNIDQYAWVADGDDTGYTRYPAQVKICVRQLCHPLSEDQFQPIIAHNYYESKLFHFGLDREQTNKLVALFTSSPVNPSISSNWNNLYTSLPGNPKRQEYNAHISKVSYASALGGTNTSTSTASSSQPSGKWSELFKSELDYETINGDKCGSANTTRDELPLNQEYEYKGNFPQADTWEGSHWDAVYTVEPEYNQTWVSELVDESPHIAPTTCGVEHDQTSDMSAQHFAKPSSSPQPLDEDADFNPSISVESVENDNEENNDEDIFLVPNTVVETSTDLQPLVAKILWLLREVIEVMKGSQLKQVVKISRLEQELVEYLDMNIGKWVPSRSMQSKRLAPAAAELNNILYVSGGYDGASYSSGDRYLATVEYLDTRMGAWVEAEPMNVSRGNFGAFIVGGKVYTVGGRKEKYEVLDIV
ncbi:hypothetical protein L1987_35870 [Smallanthus sonchifolius]|uniref:Uncharacterized protein n=1 Tax=Smallanthus sonchifolius TaxID=185202 RepID=A0ACB9HBM1_9ASTR|nr:hypothetical protein L1987_35870 [Smallanthus sonchifolius]